jgi:hypothetical protein
MIDPLNHVECAACTTKRTGKHYNERDDSDAEEPFRKYKCCFCGQQTNSAMRRIGEGIGEKCAAY